MYEKINGSKYCENENIFFFFGKSQDLKHSKMFCRGSSGRGSTGVVTWVYDETIQGSLKKLLIRTKRKVERIFYFYLFLYFHNFRVEVRGLEQCVSLSDKPKKRRRGEKSPISCWKCVWVQLPVNFQIFGYVLHIQDLSESVLICLGFCFLHILC